MSEVAGKRKHFDASEDASNRKVHFNSISCQSGMLLSWFCVICLTEKTINSSEIVLVIHVVVARLFV